MQHLIISTHFFFVLQLFCLYSVHFPACIISFSETEKGRKSLVPQFPRTRFSNMNSETADKQLNDRLVPKQFLRRNKILLDLLEGKPARPYLTAVWLLHISQGYLLMVWHLKGKVVAQAIHNKSPISPPLHKVSLIYWVATTKFIA